jgi:hypothetical protein
VPDAEEGYQMKTMTYSESRAHYAETLNAVVDDREGGGNPWSVVWL